MSKIRIYELARELGVENREVIQCAQRLGMDDKTSHSNSLDDHEADTIRRALIRVAVGGADTTTGSQSTSGVRSGGAVVSRRRGSVVSRRRNDAISSEGRTVVRRRSASSTTTSDEVSTKVEEISSVEQTVASSSPELKEELIVQNEQKSIDAQVAGDEDSNTESLTEVATSQETAEDKDVESGATEDLVSADGQEPAFKEESTSDVESNESNDALHSESEESNGALIDGSQDDAQDQPQEDPVKSSQNPASSPKGKKGRVEAVAQDYDDASEDDEPEAVINPPLPKTAEAPKAGGGPRVLGHITLPSKRLERGDVEVEGEVGGRRKRKGKGKKKEFSSKELVDYDVSNKKKKKLSKKELRSASKHAQNDDQQPKHEFSGPKASKRIVKVDEFITVGELAHQLSLKAGDVIAKLMGLGVMATINQTIDKDTVSIVADEFDYQIESTSFDEEEVLGLDEDDKVEDLRHKPPVVTVMGHVDHGKTSLLDRIRSASVADREHGGITQHIGAYQVQLDMEGQKRITFIDTPGHEAFTSMRARGAQITDIVILVVAADDGVMPQTIEGINHAKAAEVPIIVAVNKMDKPSATPDKVKQQLVEYGLQPEEWGGDTMFFPVSALNGDGVDDLLEGILLLSDIKELKANPATRASGTVIEASQQRGRGTVATVLVQRGTLRLGDIFVAGAEYGRIRSMMNDKGDRVEEVLPAMPVEITGFNGVPTAGDDFVVVETESDARDIAENRQERVARAERARDSGPITLEEFAKRAQEVSSEELNVILKADVHGSLEAVRQALENLSTEKVKVKVLHTAVGGVTESDIQLGIASNAIILGFGVRAEPRALADAEAAGIDVRFYRVIYELIDDVKNAMVGLLDPDKEEVHLGRAEVRDTFSVPKAGTIAGCYVSDGVIKRGAYIRVVRDGRVIYEGRMGSLRRFKEDVKQVQSGYECGIGVENFNDVKLGDVFEVYEFKEIAPTLE